MSRRHARIMRAFVSSHCITCSRTHDSVDPPVVIACTRQTELDFGNRGAPAPRNTLVTGLIVRIVSVSVAVSVAVSVRIIPVGIVPVGIVSIVGIKERITKIAEEDEPIAEAAMAEPIAPKAPKISGLTKARPGSCETRRHSAGCRTTAETATTPSKPSAANTAPGGTTMRPGHRNRGAQSHCCNAACEENLFCIHVKLGSLINYTPEKAKSFHFYQKNNNVTYQFPFQLDPMSDHSGTIRASRNSPQPRRRTDVGLRYARPRKVVTTVTLLQRGRPWALSVGRSSFALATARQVSACHAEAVISLQGDPLFGRDHWNNVAI